MPETHQSVTAADGVRLAVSVSGPVDAEPLLLIPGLGAAASVFDPIRPSLESRYRTVVYDPRGVGASQSGESALTMDLMVADVAAVLDGVGLSNAHVMGASMGGAVAQYFVLGQPARVARLVLAATAPGGGKAVPAGQRATDALLGKGARTPEEAYRMACTVLYSPQFQRTHSDFIEQQISWRGAHPVRPRVFSTQLAALAAAPDITDRLAQVRAPTLVMHGTQDAVTPIENARLLAASIPGARTRWFEDCGHLFFHERPEETARVMDEFLRV